MKSLLLAAPSRFAGEADQWLTRLSFPVTAAGPFRICTEFPILPHATGGGHQRPDVIRMKTIIGYKQEKSGIRCQRIRRCTNPSFTLGCIHSIVFHLAYLFGFACLCSGCAQSMDQKDKAVTSGNVVRSDCCMSFRDLFVLARKREWTAAEERHFQKVSQPERNRLVRELAAEAGCVETEDRLGTDGQTYTAFWMKRED